ISDNNRGVTNRDNEQEYRKPAEESRPRERNRSNSDERPARNRDIDSSPSRNMGQSTPDWGGSNSSGGNRGNGGSRHR
ncbi:MAG: hypothetical protein IT223_10715, partial [Crocinitomicaceae bacterium]|nr:hypothetical protein [Crocinitomicaceae bacterium]